MDTLLSVEVFVFISVDEFIEMIYNIFYCNIIRIYIRFLLEFITYVL